MSKVNDYRPLGCQECLNGTALGFDFSMAFQPIVDLEQRTIFAQEALARGIGDLPSATVFANVGAHNRYAFDQACRVKAVKLAAALQIDSILSINFMPNAVYRPELCIRTTLRASEEFGFPSSRIMFEVTEAEDVEDTQHLKNIFHEYHQQGLITAIDDFGSGYSRLQLLADLEVDVLKLDMFLSRDIHLHPRKHAIVRGIVTTCRELGVKVIAEGIESAEEFRVLRDAGIQLFQGYYFARPSYESLAEINWDGI